MKYRFLPALVVLALTDAVGAQTVPAPAPAAVAATLPAASEPAPAELSPQARELLQTLHDRRNTLKDFTAKIDYSVEHPAISEISGKRGTVSFLIDPTKGPIFTVDFTIDTDEDGKPKRTHHQQVIFDGTFVTTLDFEPKEFMRSRELPEGAQPGDAVTLNGPLTLPIGLRVDDVDANFVVTVLPPPADANRAILRLVPRAQSKFDFKQLDITIDKKLELPVELVQSARGQNSDITTIKLSDIQANTGKAKMENSTPPAGWTERKTSP